MSVKLIEPALEALLESREGPVGLEVEQRAQRVVGQAQANAEIIMHRYPQVSDAIAYDFDDQGRAIIGIDAGAGSIADYLAKKALGRVTPRSEELWPDQGWLKAALETGFNQ